MSDTKKFVEEQDGEVETETEKETEWKDEVSLGKGWKKKSRRRKGSSRKDHFYMSPEGVVCNSMAKVQQIIEMATLEPKFESSPDDEEPVKIHRCDIKLKNLFKSPEYLQLKEQLSIPKIKIKIKLEMNPSPHKIKRLSIRVKNVKLPGTKGVKTESNYLNGCNGQDSGENSTVSNGIKSIGYNGLEPLPSTSRDSPLFTGRESQQSTSRESHKSSIAGRTSRLSVTSTMSSVTDSSGTSQESSGVEVIGYGRKTVNGYEYEEEQEEEDEEVEDSSDSDEDTLEDGEIRVPSGDMNGHCDKMEQKSSKDESSRSSSSMSKRLAERWIIKKPSQPTVAKNVPKRKRNLMEIFLEDSDSEDKSDKKDEVACLSENSDHNNKKVPELGPPAKKKKFSREEIVLDDSASGVSSSFSNYFDMSSSRPASVSAEDSTAEESWKLDPESGDWKLEGSENNYRLKELFIKVKEEHCYNSRMKPCYLKFRNIRKTLAMKHRAFDDPIIVASRPGDDDGYAGLPCPFNCGAEFHIKDQMYFYEHVNGGHCPVLKEQQVVAPEKTTVCGVCRSEIPQSQIEDHHNNFHRPHPCSICHYKWKTEVELEEHILEDHASHFMADIPPIGRKHLITVWQTKHQKAGDIIPASQVFQRSLTGELIPVQCEPGQVFQRGPEGDVIPMPLSLPPGGAIGAFTPVQQQPASRLGPNGELTQVQPSLPRTQQLISYANAQIFHRPPQVLTPLSMPRISFQTGANGQRTYLRGPNLNPPRLQQVTQQSQLLFKYKLNDGTEKSILLPSNCNQVRLPDGRLIRIAHPGFAQPVIIPKLPTVPVAPANLVRPQSNWTPPVGGVQPPSNLIPRSQLPPSMQQHLAQTGNNSNMVEVHRNLPTSLLTTIPRSFLPAPVALPSRTSPIPGPSQIQTPAGMIEVASVPPEFRQPPEGSWQNVRMSEPLNIKGIPGAKVVALASKDYLAPAPKIQIRSHFTPIHPAGLSGGRVSVVKRVSPLPESSILQSQLSRPASQVIIPTQYAKSANEVVKIPPQYARATFDEPIKIPPQYAKPVQQIVAPPGYAWMNINKSKQRVLTNLPPSPTVDKDGAPLMDVDADGAPNPTIDSDGAPNPTVDADGAPTIYERMNARFNIGSQPGNEGQNMLEDNMEDTLSDPGVDPLEDRGVDPLEDSGVDPLEDPGVDPLEDQDAEDEMDILSFCSTMMTDDQESDKVLMF